MKKAQYVTTTMVSCLMLFKVKIAVYSENGTEKIQTY
jgi:hypothetical protein